MAKKAIIKKEEPKAKKPIIVSDPKRVKSYNDSLSAYNTNKRNYEKESKGYKYDTLVKGNVVKSPTNKKEKIYMESGKEIFLHKKPTTPVEYKKPDKKPALVIKKKEVVITAPKAKPIVAKQDSISFGTAGNKRMYAVKDLKGASKAGTLSGIDTTSNKTISQSGGKYNRMAEELKMGIQLFKNKSNK